MLAASLYAAMIMLESSSEVGGQIALGVKREAATEIQPFHARSWYSGNATLSFQHMNGDEPLRTYAIPEPVIGGFICAALVASRAGSRTKNLT